MKNDITRQNVRTRQQSKSGRTGRNICARTAGSITLAGLGTGEAERCGRSGHRPPTDSRTTDAISVNVHRTETLYSSEMSGFDFTLIVLRTALVVSLLGLVLWYVLERLYTIRSKWWPTAEATIETTSYEVRRGGNRGPYRLTCLAFSYSVDGQTYGGHFHLDVMDRMGVDPKPMTHMVGKKVNIRYHPKKPKKWLVPDKYLEGCRIS